MLKLFLIVLLVGLLTFLQAFGFSIFGVKPNLALVSIITVSFFIVNSQWSIVNGFLLAALAALILKFGPSFEMEILVFSLICLAAIFIKKYLPWRHFISNLVLIIFGTFIFYFFLATKLIPTFIFLEELILNLIIGSLLFTILNFLWQNKI